MAGKYILVAPNKRVLELNARETHVLRHVLLMAMEQPAMFGSPDDESYAKAIFVRTMEDLRRRLNRDNGL